MTKKNEMMRTIDYYKVITKDVVLSREEEKKLIIKASDGDKKAQETLVLANFKYALYVANKTKFSNIDFDDLVEECVIGLLEASQHIDKKFCNNKFITYANFWILNRSRDAVNRGRTITLPEKRFDLLKKVKGVYSKYMSKLDDEKKCRELTAKELKMTEDKVNELLMLSENALSLETIYEKDQSGRGYEDYIEDDRYLNPEDEYIVKDRKRVINLILKRLPEREATIMIKRNGLDGNPPMNCAEIAREMGCTRAWTSSIERSAKLHLMKYKNELEDLIA